MVRNNITIAPFVEQSVFIERLKMDRSSQIESILKLPEELKRQLPEAL